MTEHSGCRFPKKHNENPNARQDTKVFCLCRKCNGVILHIATDVPASVARRSSLYRTKNGNSQVSGRMVVKTIQHTA